MSFLSTVGKDFKAVFSWLGSTQGQNTITAVEAGTNTIVALVNPAAAVALTGIEALINAGLKQVVSIESVAAAAGSQTGTGAQKSAAVIAAVTPNVASFLQSIGVTSPTSTQVQTIATTLGNSLVTVLNSIPTPAPTTSAPITPAPTPTSTVAPVTGAAVV